jgi:hypothetical protein
LETEEFWDTGYDSVEMRKAFFNRLSQLARTIRDSRPRENETQEQFEERCTGNSARKRQRAHTRRSTVRTICISYTNLADKWHLYDTRKKITEFNRLNRDGNLDMAWATLDYVVDTLTTVGMSSDESDNDSSGKTEYVIQRMPWRSRYLTELLRHIDKDRNKTNGLGGRRRGNAPRSRVWLPGARESTREAPPRLPINFYDKVWYNNLSRRDERELQAADEVEPPPARPRAIDASLIRCVSSQAGARYGYFQQGDGHPQLVCE